MFARIKASIKASFDQVGERMGHGMAFGDDMGGFNPSLSDIYGEPSTPVSTASTPSSASSVSSALSVASWTVADQDEPGMHGFDGLPPIRRIVRTPVVLAQVKTTSVPQTPKSPLIDVNKYTHLFDITSPPKPYAPVAVVRSVAEGGLTNAGEARVAPTDLHLVTAAAAHHVSQEGSDSAAFSEEAGIASLLTKDGAVDAITASEAASESAVTVRQPSLLGKEVEAGQVVTRATMSSTITGAVTNKLDRIAAQVVTNTQVEEFKPTAQNPLRRALEAISPGKGYASSVLSSLMKTGSVFVINPITEATMRNLNASEETIKGWGFSISGMMVGVMTTPFSVAKLQRYITQQSTKQIWAGLFKTPEARRVLGTAARYAVVKEGLFWKLFPGFIEAGQATFADVLQNLAKSSSPVDQEWSKVLNYPVVNGMVTFVIGAGAGLAAAMVTYPLDVFQKKLQKHPEMDGIALMQKMYAKHNGNLADIIRKSFYKGARYAAIRMPLAMGAMTVAVSGADYCYENIVKVVARVSADALKKDPTYPMRAFR